MYSVLEGKLGGSGALIERNRKLRVSVWHILEIEEAIRLLSWEKVKFS